VDRQQAQRSDPIELEARCDVFELDVMINLDSDHLTPQRFAQRLHPIRHRDLRCIPPKRHRSTKDDTTQRLDPEPATRPPARSTDPPFISGLYSQV